MADAPDPLGKRALYWAPAERTEDGPPRADDPEVAGKRALFSDAGPVPSDSTPGGPATTRFAPSAASARVLSGRSGHPSQRPSSEDGAGRGARPHHGGRPDELERPVGSGMFGSLTLLCSSCRVQSHVDVVEYVMLHLPLWFWRPGRGFTKFMACPACHRRTWISAQWTGWSR